MSFDFLDTVVPLLLGSQLCIAASEEWKIIQGVIEAVKSEVNSWFPVITELRNSFEKNTKGKTFSSMEQLILKMIVLKYKSTTSVQI